MDALIGQMYHDQIATLEQTALRRLQGELLLHKSAPDAAVRKQALLFETVVEDLQVPSLGLTREKAVRELAPKLNDMVESFPDSPLAQIQRARKVDAAVAQPKKKTKGGPSVGWGVDLVAVLRPDGFGTLQGFCGYNLGQHSITLGVHNDADEPGVLAQFGGVRPPLLRFQPKLRLDVEL